MVRRIKRSHYRTKGPLFLLSSLAVAWKPLSNDEHGRAVMLRLLRSRRITGSQADQKRFFVLCWCGRHQACRKRPISEYQVCLRHSSGKRARSPRRECRWPKRWRPHEQARNTPFTCLPIMGLLCYSNSGGRCCAAAQACATFELVLGEFIDVVKSVSPVSNTFLRTLSTYCLPRYSWKLMIVFLPFRQTQICSAQPGSLGLSTGAASIMLTEIVPLGSPGSWLRTGLPARIAWPARSSVLSWSCRNDLISRV